MGRRAPANHRNDLIIQLGGYAGLRPFEFLQIEPRHAKRIADGDHYRLRVPEGENTTIHGEKPRGTYLPADIEVASNAT